MALDNPFSLDEATDNTEDTQRTKKLKALGPNLRSLLASANPVEDLSQEPLNQGEISQNTSIPEDVGEPSQIATERVQRAPALAEEGSPLLSAEERLGNLATGE